NRRPRRAWRWGMGWLKSSVTFFYRLVGIKDREPGQYHFIAYDGTVENKTLERTNELVHASVRARWQEGGLSYRGKPYNQDCPALMDWKLVVSAEPDYRYEDGEQNCDRNARYTSPSHPLRAKWIYEGNNPAGYQTDENGKTIPKEMAEDGLGLFERELLDLDGNMRDALRL
ncbi:hypothetical protein LTS18_011204, partial [Coniosporium uncinatum]